MYTEPMRDAAISRPLRMGGAGPVVVVKESIDIKGISTRCGSPALADRPIAEKNAAVVDALLASECNIVGTANMHELAFGVTGINQYLGTPTNPRWPNRIPGGSSSGSASIVASGGCDFAVGTDTGGSVRLPACCCGVFGMKPSFGRISRSGVVPAESTLDCVGPIAASVDMLIRAMECMDNAFSPDQSSGPFRLRKVDVKSDRPIAATFEDAVASLTLSTVKLHLLEAAYHAGLVIINAESAAAFGGLARQSEALDPAVRARILSALDNFDSQELEEAEEMRAKFRGEVDQALDGYDALVLPTMPVVPPTLEEAQDMRALISLTAYVRPFNLSGHPAITIPVTTAEGLPAGVQLVGRYNEDAQLCAVAKWLVEGMAGNKD